MLQFTGRGSQYCVSAVGGFARREGGLAAGLLRQWPLLLLTLLSTALITESANAGVIKLNGELPSGGNVDSYGLQFSPDGSRVLYRADQDTDQVFELYSVPATGGTPVKLNGELTSGGNVDYKGLQFSPDGSRVLYNADQDTDGVFELYSVPATGGTPVKLNAGLPSGGNVDSYGLQFSPDGSRVLYRADQDTNGVTELYSVPATGGAPVKLNAELPSNGDVRYYGLQFSPDGSRVLYRANQDTDSIFEIYSVPVMGGTPVKLNAELILGGEVSSSGLQFSPDGSRVLYLADQETDDVWELYSVPATGGTPVKLNSALPSDGDVHYYGLQFSPDGSRVLYLADRDKDEVLELYSVPAAGGEPVKLNTDLTPGGSVNPFGVQFSPDGSRVLYTADDGTIDGRLSEVFELYSVSAAGGEPVKLNKGLPSGGNVSWEGLQFSPDGSRVLYLADQVTNGVTELYSVPATGGEPIKLNAKLPVDGDGDVSWRGLQFSPDGSRVLYTADQETDEIFEIYSVPATGGTPVKLNAELTSGGYVTPFGVRLSPDGSRVLYNAAQDTDEVFEIYSVPAAGDTPVKLNSALPSGGNLDRLLENCQLAGSLDLSDIFHLNSSRLHRRALCDPV